MDYLIGLDVGTSSVKAVLMSTDGKIKDVKTKKHNYFFENDMKLLDGEEFCENCFAVIKEIANETASSDAVRAICVSGASGNLVLTKNGKCISPVYGWQTGFDESVTEKILSSLTRDDVYETVGWPKLKGFPMAGIAYLKETNPELLENADKICMHIEYLNYRMTGKWGITPSMGTPFFLIDQAKGEYYREYMNLLGIEEEKLLPIVKNCSVLGTVTQEACTKLGLPEGIPVVAGSFDHPAAARGTGTFDETDVMVSCGTSWVVFVPFKSRDIPKSKNMLIDPYMSPEGNWCGMKSMTSVSEQIDKMKEKFLGDVSYEEFDSLAAASFPGCNGLVIKDENTDVSGFERSDIARAIMENISQRLREFLDCLEISAENIKLVGGITNSKVWCKVISEITGKNVDIINGEHAGAIGSAIMAGVGSGIYKNEKEAFRALNFR